MLDNFAFYHLSINHIYEIAFCWCYFVVYFIIKVLEPNHFFFFLQLGALCHNALGMQNNRIRSNQLTASSTLNPRYSVNFARLNKGSLLTRDGGAWVSRHNNHNQWIKTDFKRPMKITKIATQGRSNYNYWVTLYNVYCSQDNIHWNIFRYKNNDKVRK